MTTIPNPSRESSRPNDSRITEQRRATKLEKTAAGLVLFAVAPDAAHIRRHVVLAALGQSDTTLWRRIKEGKFPPPQYDGRLAYWTAGQVRAALVSPL